ncbi:TetR/AcrR family transcriptional regulator [Streptomyces sp. NPDC002589]|uniref:TetR/AcrR family transcriptional regulator n=1 Tax=Streptomyces sp. NPDC002589 TaxID=3154420 RepID=UPI0033260278
MQETEPQSAPVGGRVNKKLRTRAAIVSAAVELMRTGGEVTMPEVAKAALVSEATAYRYFPDLASLLQESMAGQWPTPEQALRSVADSTAPPSGSRRLRSTCCGRRRPTRARRAQ